MIEPEKTRRAVERLVQSARAMELRTRSEIPNGVDRFCSLDASKGAKSASESENAVDWVDWQFRRSNSGRHGKSHRGLLFFGQLSPSCTRDRVRRPDCWRYSSGARRECSRAQVGRRFDLECPD